MGMLPIGCPTKAAVTASRRPVARARAVGALAMVGAAGVVASLASLCGRPLSMEDGLGYVATTLPVAELLTCIRRDTGPPLYYLLLRGWSAIGGDSAAWLRLFSALHLVIAAAGLSALARRLWPGDRAATWVVPLAWLILPYTLWYGTYVKMYALEAALFVWGVVAALRALETGRAHDHLSAGLVQLAGLYTHYWLIFPMAVLAGFELIQRRSVGGGVLRYVVIIGLGLPWVGVACEQYRGFTDGYAPVYAVPVVLLVLPSQVILLWGERWPGTSWWCLGIALVVAAAAGVLAGRGERRLPGLLLVLPVLLAFAASAASGIILVHPAHLFPVVTMLPLAVWQVARRVPEAMAAAWGFPVWRLGTLILGGLMSLPGVEGVADELRGRVPGSWVVIASPYLYAPVRWALRGQPDVYAIARPADPRIPGLSALPWMPSKTLDQVAAAGALPAIYIIGHAQRPTVEPPLPDGWSRRSTRTYNECMSLGSPIEGQIRLCEYGPPEAHASAGSRADAVTSGRSGG